MTSYILKGYIIIKKKLVTLYTIVAVFCFVFNPLNIIEFTTTPFNGTVFFLLGEKSCSYKTSDVSVFMITIELYL